MSNYAFIGMVCALCISALGSGLGAGTAAQASVGGWKKCYAEGKPAPFILVAFSGAPLTQTIYGFLLMNFIRSSALVGNGNTPLAVACGVSVVWQLAFLVTSRARLQLVLLMLLQRQVRVLQTSSSLSVSLRQLHSLHSYSQCFSSANR